MKLIVKRNFDEKHWPSKYAIYDIDSMSDVKAYTSDTEIFDWLNADPIDLLDDETAAEHHAEALRKATELYNEALEAFENENKQDWAKKFVIRDREAGNLITYCDTIEEAEDELKKFIADDEKEGYDNSDFYEIVEANVNLNKFGEYESED